MKKNNPIPNVLVYKDNAGGGVSSDETYITTGLGGKGYRLRNYVVISTLNNTPNYALIKILVSVEVALQDIIDEAMNFCDAVEKFLRFHFYATKAERQW